jgi:hypothetical protein
MRGIDLVPTHRAAVASLVRPNLDQASIRIEQHFELWTDGLRLQSPVQTGLFGGDAD